MASLEGQVALVTGAATGIGRATAVRLAADGARVVVNYLDQPDKARETCQQVEAATGDKNRAMSIQGDISCQEDVEALLDSTLQQWERLDILVNNAGILENFPEDAISPLESYEQTLRVNLTGAYICAKLAIEHFLSAGTKGNVVNISSVHDVIPDRSSVPYAISKCGMRGLTENFALKFGKKGIRVNAVAPAKIETPLCDWRDDREAIKRLKEYIPLGRVGQPDDVAAAVAFLVSQEASFITGHTLYVDGGCTLHPAFP